MLTFIGFEVSNATAAAFVAFDDRVYDVAFYPGWVDAVRATTTRR